MILTIPSTSGLSVTNLATVLLLPHDLENLFISYQRVMQTVLTSRVILHMRSQVRQGQNAPYKTLSG
ncbi:hypothetical protein BDP27DRAFT_1329585 [Rhodocollybia butyracea]|uniref:Uncharacterized protein n=1 Tax=Rhodocollybia butyracea TaxID=206335 RepID=A0A9P5PPB3_9AGAR|nr:hypothetical protein BDP27DRAFT_1329585 [Rhodocollybia butyracea]